jgi:cold shock CspA family protein/ribosome-associated translation inhibitor RaiA
MQITPTVTFRGIHHSDALEADIRARIGKLGTYYESIIGCRVLVEMLQRHHERGNRCHVRIDLTVPGDEIVVSHEARIRSTVRQLQAEKTMKAQESDPGRKQAYTAVHDAFDIARRQLQDFARRQRGAVKQAARPPRGRVVRLFPIGEFGYIETRDGHEVYFQKSAVVGGPFDRLTVGSIVAFTEEAGQQGPQASTVRLTHPRAKRPPSKSSVSGRSPISSAG